MSANSPRKKARKNQLYDLWFGHPLAAGRPSVKATLAQLKTLSEAARWVRRNEIGSPFAYYSRAYNVYYYVTVDSGLHANVTYSDALKNLKEIG